MALTMSDADDADRPGAPAARPASVETSYLLVVSRRRPDLFAVAVRRFGGDPRLEIILDRRRGEERRRQPGGSGTAAGGERRRAERRRRPDFWEDLRFHDVVLAARRQPVTDRFDVHAEPTGGGGMTERWVETEQGRRLLKWLEEGQDILGRLLPELAAEYDALRARAEAAEEREQRLLAEIRELRSRTEAIQREWAEVRHLLVRTRSELVGTTEALMEIERRLSAL